MKKLLIIGDNIRTDIKGANNMKLDSLLITNGIHKKEFLNQTTKNYDDDFNQSYGVKNQLLSGEVNLVNYENF